MTLPRKHLRCLSLLIVLITLPQKSESFFTKQNYPPARPLEDDADDQERSARAPHPVTTHCEKLSQSCDRQTGVCTETVEMVECTPPSTPSGRNQCYASWRNTPPEGFKFEAKGCWTNDHSCRDQTCRQRPPVREIYFCCCEGDMCNRNVTFYGQIPSTRQAVSPTTGPTTGILPPVVKDRSQVTKAILCSILPIMFGTILIVTIYFFWKVGA